ncbi:hypothetical protein F9K88_13090 [Brucella intermedia]|nr:hypothetical protein F9K77_20105 [Ochrobactrum sp. LMG 5442]KAB2710141.1 hypothetical protein F9K88_13090 [Brucella intermedia]PJT24958.1 hypothetical protein CN884_08625 [Ochrobactrum sp. 30A/1000/2015]PJT40408.1 hypothetical protein CN883_02610 [Ochrobactrum sp. 27A/999/2015]PJT42958.1 hypothetical protein CN882_13440 [Ochrobactrum sp. 23A/997/2015]HCH71744.1 hypothetical protein [Ochrobactrum sp.]
MAISFAKAIDLAFLRYASTNDSENITTTDNHLEPESKKRYVFARMTIFEYRSEVYFGYPSTGAQQIAIGHTGRFVIYTLMLSW